MFIESDLAERIQSATGYVTELTVENISNMMESGDNLPLVYVGHLGIRLQNPEQFWSNSFSELENQQVLHTAVQFICLRDDIVTVRSNIYNAVTKYTPYVSDISVSTINFLEGRTLAVSGNRIWWQDTWGFIFPQIAGT